MKFVLSCCLAVCLALFGGHVSAQIVRTRPAPPLICGQAAGQIACEEARIHEQTQRQIDTTIAARLAEIQRGGGGVDPTAAREERERQRRTTCLRTCAPNDADCECRCRGSGYELYDRQCLSSRERGQRVTTAIIEGHDRTLRTHHDALSTIIRAQADLDRRQRATEAALHLPTAPPLPTVDLPAMSEPVSRPAPREQPQRSTRHPRRRRHR